MVAITEVLDNDDAVAVASASGGGGGGGSQHKVTSVLVTPAAAVAMAAHGIRHAQAAVQGLLMGHYDAATQRTTVTSAVPVSHGPPPTTPMVELALGLVQQSEKATTAVQVVGWYTAPMLLDDTQPGPVALRMAAQLSSSSVESILLVVHNLSLAALVVSQSAAVGTKAAAESLLRAFGRDFGNQWMAPIADLVVEQPESVAKAIAQLGLTQNFAASVVDLMDHLESENDQGDGGWLFPNQSAVSELIARTT
jgi:Uncharacterised protein family (UPF0172)